MRRLSCSLLALTLLVVAQPGNSAEAAKPVVLITGANRGIGLELVRQYSARHWRVIATARDVSGATELQALAGSDKDISIERLDVTDHTTIDALQAKYRDQPIDVLISNAGKTPRYMSAMKGSSSIDYAEARNSYETNALGPLKLVADFMPNVEKSAQKKIAVISSKAGSFGEGPKMSMMYEYRASKAALNMIVYTLGFETAKKGIVIAAISPGSVATTAVKGELGYGTNMKAPGAIPPSDSVSGIIKVIDGLTPNQNGQFLDYKDGRVIPW
jgi:NAD(P)-dependent dehydrogenase (short-subunit alcohol dehydrogenase family)